MASVRLPFATGSNLVFSADGRHIFLRSKAGELWSVDVPRDTREPLRAPRRELDASAGSVVAAGWIEGRLATVVVEHDTLFATHGAWDVESGTSGPLRIAFRAEELVLGDHSRLDPYLRWCAESNPVEQMPDALTLVRGDDRRLFSVMPPTPAHGLARLALVAEEVVFSTSLDGDCRTVAFEGRLPVLSRRFWDRVAGRGVTEEYGVFELGRRGGWRPVPRYAVDGHLPLAIVACTASESFVALIAVESSARVWTILSDGPDLSIRAPAEHEVVGVLGLRTGPGPVLVLVDLNAASVILVDGRGKQQTAVSIGGPIERIASSVAEPLIAYVRDGHLHVDGLV